MKKGVLVYDFNNVWYLKDNNIGDYVQSLAALEIVGEDWRDKIYIEREDLKALPTGLKENEKVASIMNGWYLHRGRSLPLNDAIIPFFTSVHLTKSFKLTSKVVEVFKKFEPIGCRDMQSARRLNEKGVNAYFSGCLTLTFNKRENNRKGLLFVMDNIKGLDSYEKFVKWEGSEIIIKELKKQFSEDEIRNAEFIVQMNEKDLGHERQFEIAEEWLERLSSKELVVTTRIHSLMPSMSLGTPALFIMRNNKDLRFEGLKDYWNYIDFTNYKKNKKDVETFILRSEDGKIINNESFRDFMLDEKQKIKKWWDEKFN